MHFTCVWEEVDVKRYFLIFPSFLWGECWDCRSEQALCKFVAVLCPFLIDSALLCWVSLLIFRRQLDFFNMPMVLTCKNGNKMKCWICSR
jgi:hypothetical protein